MLRSQFEESLNDLYKQLLMMGRMAEEAVQKSMKSLVEKDIHLARTVIEEDQAVNEAEAAIEKTCIGLIALQQPVGTDLRKIATALKVSTDLERIADHAVSVAKTTIELKDHIYVKPLIDIPRMGELVQAMIREALDAYIRMDRAGAIQIAAQDDEVDALYKSIFDELLELMSEEKALISQAAHLLFAAQFLERIGDYVTNICEWIVYLESGEMAELNN